MSASSVVQNKFSFQFFTNSYVYKDCEPKDISGSFSSKYFLLHFIKYICTLKFIWSELVSAGGTNQSILSLKIISGSNFDPAIEVWRGNCCVSNILESSPVCW